MRFAEDLLYRLSKRWPSPVKERKNTLGLDPSSETYNLNYALTLQFDYKVKNGMQFDIRNKSIVEIGCGHGGISVFMALNGASSVVGIDLNTSNLAYAAKFKKTIERELSISKPLQVEFHEMNAYEMNFGDRKFDMVFADNVFEHFMNPEKVIQESWKILENGGYLVVPKFSSIWSKYALHLKNGLKLPWANLFFSEKTICNVMVRLSKEDPNIEKIYPGVKNRPKKVRDLRRYGDLNDITYGSFKRMARRNGFEIVYFITNPSPRLLGYALRRVPFIKNSLLVDIFSVNSKALLRKIC